MTTLFHHANAEDLANLKPFTAPHGLKRIVHNNKKGYDILQMESAAISAVQVVEVLLEVSIRDLDTNMSTVCYLHDTDMVTFMNSGHIARSLAGTHKGLIVQHQVKRATGDEDVKNGAIEFQSGCMMTNYKHRFEIILRNPESKYEHVLVCWKEEPADTDIQPILPDNN